MFCRAIVYTKHQAIGRAVERAMQDADSFCVYQHRDYPSEYIVKTRASSPPRNFKRIFTAEGNAHDKATVYAT